MGAPTPAPSPELFQALITSTAGAVEFVAYGVFGGVVLMVVLGSIKVPRRDDLGDNVALEWFLLL